MSQAAKMLHMDRRSLYMRIAAMEQLEQVRCEIKEEYLDFSESQLMKAVEKGEAWAICFHLKCQGKERGWIEQVAMMNNDCGGGMTIEFIDSLVHDSNYSAIRCALGWCWFRLRETATSRAKCGAVKPPAPLPLN